MATVIKIKNTSVDKAPIDGLGNSILAVGELAYSFYPGAQNNNGDRIYIGTGTETDGYSSTVDVIGGKYFTDLLDHVHGTLTASSAIVVDSNKKIDELRIDNIQVGVAGTNVISIDQVSDANGDISIVPGGTGDVIVTATNIELNGAMAFTGDQVITGDVLITGAGKGNLNVDAQATLASANVEDLTDNRIVIVGTGGELEDDANFTFDGTTFKVGTSVTDKFRVDVATGNTATTGTLSVADAVTFTKTSGVVLDVNGQTTLASLNVEDLTATRITFAGANGELVDDVNFTFDAVNDKLTLVGSAQIDNVTIDANTISTVAGALTIAPNANSETIIDTTSAVRVPVGTSNERPTAATGQIRYNTTTSQYEGYSSGAWQGLGGVIDTDQNTYIIAQPTSNLPVPSTQNADTLYFVTGGAFQGQIDTATGWTLNNVNIDDNTISTTSGDMYLDPGQTGAGSPTGNVVVYGNLNVMGTTTTIDSTTVTVDDPVFTLGGDTAPTSDDNKDRGIEFRWHNGTDAKVGFFGWDDSASRFKFIDDASNVSEVFSGAAGDVEFGNMLIDSITFQPANFVANSVPWVDTNGDVGFLEEDNASPYGVTGQVLQYNSSGLPVFGHIDCGTYS